MFKQPGLVPSLSLSTDISRYIETEGMDNTLVFVASCKDFITNFTAAIYNDEIGRLDETLAGRVYTF